MPRENRLSVEATRHPVAGTPVTFGELLRKRRLQQGLSLSRLAAMVHFDRGHISKVETDKRPPSIGFAEACDRALRAGDTFTTIAVALEAAARQQQGWVLPAQLPAGQRNFVGRQRLLDQLDTVLHGGLRSLAVPVAVVDGQPGVGKTALAVHWAHRAVAGGHFGDGQLFVDLCGPDPATAASPATVLDDLLQALGVPRDQIPVPAEQKAATFRSFLHGREILLVLDNAADTTQIRQLLPGFPGCAVIVTTRVRLPGLTSHAGAITLTVPELPPADAVTLLRAIIGDEPADADPPAVALLADRCGHLPLALMLAAEHIVTGGHRSAAALAADLKSESGRMGLAAGNLSVRGALEPSYRLLNEPAARLFRLLGLHSGTLIDPALAAALTGAGNQEAARLLRELTNLHLLRRHDERHYQLPDLLRGYASELTKQLDPEPDRDQALARLTDWYLR
jgi:transcriptional regulator with XRE-family HTH domain